MGFLLGAVVNQVTDTISDSQIRDEKTETIINVSSILPLPLSCRVINSAGKIDKEKLSLIVRSEKNQQLRNGSQSHDIVGWYSFKRNSVFQMSMREHVVHLQLAEMAKDFSLESTPELFVMCLLSNNLTSQATHVFKHSFMRYLSEKQTFDLIPLQIHNLGMTLATQYQSTVCASSKAALLKEIFDRISSQNQGRDHMLQVQAELQIMLNQHVHQLSDSENSRIKLESEVEQIMERVQMLETLKREKQSKEIPFTQGYNNGSETFPQERPRDQRQQGKNNSYSRTVNRSATRDINQEHGNPGCKSSENHINNERTSPVLGSCRRRPSRP